jgi:hypothetical protein
MCLLPIIPSTPTPSSAWKFVTVSRSIFCSVALTTTASARGCSESFSTLALARSISVSVHAVSREIISVTSGFPFVIVPVLSRTTVST